MEDERRRAADKGRLTGGEERTALARKAALVANSVQF